MTSLSVVVITLNEAENIKDCLDSVQWADEIIVVDSGSQDQTVEICRKYTEFVHHLPWQGFGRQKNAAVDLAHHDWILSIDADERVSPELRDEIKSLLRNEPELPGYRISRKSYFGKRLVLTCGWHPDESVRLFNRKKGRFNDVQVHESVRMTGGTGQLKGSLLHYTYRNISDFMTRMERYSTLAANELFSSGKSAGLKIIFRPPVTFIKMFIIRKGFKEGLFGVILCGLYAFYTFVKYSKLWEMNRHGKL